MLKKSKVIHLSQVQPHWKTEGPGAHPEKAQGILLDKVPASSILGFCPFYPGFQAFFFTVIPLVQIPCFLFPNCITTH